MKKIKKIFTFLLALICSINFCMLPTYAASPATNTFSLENTSEIVEIEGTNYKFDYYTEAGMRTVTVTNMVTNTVDKVAYDPVTSTFYLNNSVFAVKSNISESQQTFSASAEGWETLSTGSHRITWAQGTTVAVVAAAIAVYLGTLGTAGVIAAMGVAALGALAASCSGGTLYMEIQMFSAPLVTPQYRYVWTFTASTGDSYGPYISHIY